MSNSDIHTTLKFNNCGHIANKKFYNLTIFYQLLEL